MDTRPRSVSLVISSASGACFKGKPLLARPEAEGLGVQRGVGLCCWAAWLSGMLTGRAGRGGVQAGVSWSLAVTWPAGQLAGVGTHTPLCRGRGMWEADALAAGPNPTAPRRLRAEQTDRDQHLTLRAKAYATRRAPVAVGMPPLCGRSGEAQATCRQESSQQSRDEPPFCATN